MCFEDARRDADRWRLEDAVYFYGGPFSNFASTVGLRLEEGWFGHPRPGGFVVAASVEHYFQAVKARSRGDFFWVLSAERARIAKRRGSRHGEGGRCLELRPDWEEVKFGVMRYACLRKFELPYFRELLLGTGDRPLVEDSPTDAVWGGRDADGGYGGQNLLGLALMEVRSDLRRR